MYNLLVLFYLSVHITLETHSFHQFVYNQVPKYWLLKVPINLFYYFYHYQVFRCVFSSHRFILFLVVHFTNGPPPRVDTNVSIPKQVIPKKKKNICSNNNIDLNKNLRALQVQVHIMKQKQILGRKQCYRNSRNKYIHKRIHITQTKDIPVYRV